MQNKDKHALYMRERRKDPIYKKREKALRRLLYKRNPKKYSFYYHKYYQELKEQVYNKLGRKCVGCGFDDIRALQIDHINGGGNKDRRSTTPINYLLRVIKDTEQQYQILCANCNWIKRYEENRRV